MATRLIAAALLALSLLPVANLIPGGEADAEYLPRLLDWLNGLALCAVVGGLAGYLVHIRGRRRDRTPDAGLHVAEWSDTASVSNGDFAGTTVGAGFAAALALGAFLLYAATSWFVLSAKPLLIDEIVQVLQARWFASGRLWVPVPPVPEFFAITHVVELDGRMFGQFPPGGPAMLALGSLVGAEWIVGPVAGALSVGLFTSLQPSLDPGASRRAWRGTALLFSVAPFGVFMFASHMNHATALMWLLLATLALARCSTDARATAAPAWGFVTGLALGIAATIRPLDAFAFALPAGCWLLWRARRGRSEVGALLASGVGVALPIAAMMWVNARTTGAPLLFGYDVLWGADHALGFHPAPWGVPHTPARGVELVSIYFTRVSTYLLEAPFPAMLLVALGLVAAGVRSAMDRYLLVASGLVVVGYWAYWHDGYFLGPRFFFPLFPALVLWSARGVRALDGMLQRSAASRVALRAAGAAAVLLAVVSIAFIRVPAYRNGLTSMRFDVESEAARAGVHDALVLVKESWGSRLVVRMWALDVPRPVAERIYRNSDVCRLELSVRALEASVGRSAATSAEATDQLLPLVADSAALVRAPGFAEKWVPGREWPPACLALRAEDERGQSHLPPFRLARGGNVYARWLPGREAEAAALYPGRPVYRLDRAGPEPDAALVWRRLSIGDQ